jgi:hypothetical protein
MMLGGDIQFATEARLAMRKTILLGISLVIAYWVDQHYYNGMYSAPLTDMLHHIAISFK